MSFESPFAEDSRWQTAPGGFEIGIQGWAYGEPVPKSITFFLDNSAMVCDQYGRHIRRSVNEKGDFLFADRPPDINRDGEIIPRAQFATHLQVVESLKAEGVDWLSYEVRYISIDNRRRARPKLTLDEAIKLQVQIIQQGNREVIVCRTVEFAGWPQLPYEELKKLTQLPPTPEEELRRIRDPQLRRDALRIKHEFETARAAKTADIEEDEE